MVDGERNMSAPATEKQLRFLAALVEDRVWPDPQIPDPLSEEIAATLIDHALKLPLVERDPVPVGLYLYHGVVFRVRQSKTTGHRYAEEMVVEGAALPVGRWKLARGRANRVSERLNWADAVRLGRATGVCHVCGNRLVNNDGIHEGCRKRLET
jgi:hypothetical protein